MISFNEKEKIFKLDTPNSTYAIGIFEENYLLNLYYGAKIDDVTGLFALARREPQTSFSPRNPNVKNGDFSVDAYPMEYPCSGSGDFRVSALSVKNADGNTVTDIRYVSHKIYSGKKDLEGLPHTYVNSENEADTLEILTEDKLTGLRATLIYTCFNNLDVITRSVKLENLGKESLEIQRIFSMSLDLPTMDFDLITLYGRHFKERNREQRALAHGLQGIQSIRGSSSHNHNPFAALLRHGANEDWGDAYGFNLIYSGNFEITAECDFNASTRLIMGMSPTAFSWELKENESFQSPEAVMVFTQKGLGEMSRIFHRLYSNNLIRGRYKTEKRPLLINSWEAAYFDFNTDKLVSFARHAKDLCIEMLVMDDGWFGKRDCDNCSLGDWYVNEKKLSGGLSKLIEKVNALGLKFGIWFEPEMISPDSDLFRLHPDWLVHVKGRTPSIARTQYVLDVSRKDVRDNIFEQMQKILSENKIDYLKWDYNRNISEAGSALLDSAHQGEFFHRFILGTYELMERLTKAFPDVLFENCSGGGGRFDPGMLYYSPQIWASDNTDPIERLTIQFGTSMCYPASTMGAHVSAVERTGYKTKGDVALWGTFGYELDPNKLLENDKEIIKEQIKDYHKYYDLIRYGDLFRLIDPNINLYRCAWCFVSPNKDEALLTAVTMRQPPVNTFILKMKGLKAEKHYLCSFDNNIYSGSHLMNAGLNLTGVISLTNESVKIHFKEVH